MDTKEMRKKKLLEEKHILEEEIEKHKNPTSFGHDVDDFDEETEETEDTANRLGLLDTFEKQLREINKALEELENE